MKFGTRWIYAVLVLTLLVWSCSKDKKTTIPEDTTPSAGATLGEDEISFGSVGAVYIGAAQSLGLAFAQTQSGGYPLAAIAVTSINTVQVGVPVECGALTLNVIDSTDVYACGATADSALAVADITFSRLELTSGGLVSGSLSGMAEHLNHPAEPLVPLELEFANIPVVVY